MAYVDDDYKNGESNPGDSGGSGGQGRADITARYLVPDLPASVTEADLQDYFGTLGELEEVSVKELSSGKTFGSVKFASPTVELRKAMLYQKHEIHGCKVSVQTWKMQKLSRPGVAGKMEFGKGKPDSQRWDGGAYPYASGKGDHRWGIPTVAGKGKGPPGGRELWGPPGGKDFWGPPCGAAKGKGPPGGGDFWGPAGGSAGDFWGPYGAAAKGKGPPGKDAHFYGGKGVDHGGGWAWPPHSSSPGAGPGGGGCGPRDPPAGKGHRHHWSAPGAAGKGDQWSSPRSAAAIIPAGGKNQGSQRSAPEGASAIIPTSSKGQGSQRSVPGGAAGVIPAGGKNQWSPPAGASTIPDGGKSPWSAAGSSPPAGSKEEESKDITARYLLPELPEALGQEELEAYFCVFGQLEEVTVKKIESSGKFTGSVKFSNPTMELRDQMLKERHEIDGYPIAVQTWKMQKMAKPGYREKKAEENAQRAAMKGSKGWGKGWGFAPY